MVSTVSIGESLEATLQNACRIDDAWSYVEHAMTSIRLSGSDDEERSVAFLKNRLDEWGVQHQTFTPTTFISWPLKATLRVLGEDGFSVMAKNPSMSVSTGGKEVEGELVYVPTAYATGAADLFETGHIAEVDVRGKVVLTEGFPFEGKVRELTQRGAAATVFVGPGERIHEGITSSIWGSPDLDTMDRQVSVPILAINRPEGLRLIEMAKQGSVRIAYSTNVETGWRPIRILEATIPGSVLPDEFVLLHAHLDSWHEGIGDNATGNALLLELARVLQQMQSDLVRTVKIVWWSGHSHGRYAGSAWYVDEFGIDLMERCVAHINSDSPGCRWAATYNDMMWTEEAGPLTTRTVQDVTGIEPTWARPIRAGDYSFSNLGITGMFMLSSTMTPEHRQELGYYQVGGCGGNIAWHTEDDVLDIADRDNLLRDIRMYGTTVLRTVNAPILPLDFRLTVDGFRATLDRYQATAGDRFDFSRAFAELDRLRADLDAFYQSLPDNAAIDAQDEVARSATRTQMELGRLLVSVGYAREGHFHQDPAENIPALPDLAVVSVLASSEPGSHLDHAAQISLRRGMNRLVNALRRAREAAGGSPGAGE
ncbi:MAG: M28 family peptidase [Thermomicrobiales bacterium]|jgi:hypothetical protein|nr:M28 family peptidase [Thermomicrobiales bacterium]